MALISTLAAISALLFGVFAFPLYALCAAHMNGSNQSDGFVEASSGLPSLFAAGAIPGPILASFAVRSIGPQGLFLFAAGVHVALATFTGHRMMRRKARPEAAREPFVDSIRVAQTVATIDPLQPHDDAAPPREPDPSR